MTSVSGSTVSSELLHFPTGETDTYGINPERQFELPLQHDIDVICSQLAQNISIEIADFRQQLTDYFHRLIQSEPSNYGVIVKSVNEFQSLMATCKNEPAKVAAYNALLYEVKAGSSTLLYEAPLTESINILRFESRHLFVEINCVKQRLLDDAAEAYCLENGLPPESLEREKTRLVCHAAKQLGIHLGPRAKLEDDQSSNLTQEQLEFFTEIIRIRIMPPSLAAHCSHYYSHVFNQVMRDYYCELQDTSSKKVGKRYTKAVRLLNEKLKGELESKVFQPLRVLTGDHRLGLETFEQSVADSANPDTGPIKLLVPESLHFLPKIDEHFAECLIENRERKTVFSCSMGDVMSHGGCSFVIQGRSSRHEASESKALTLNLLNSLTLDILPVSIRIGLVHAALLNLEHFDAIVTFLSNNGLFSSELSAMQYEFLSIFRQRFQHCPNDKSFVTRGIRTLWPEEKAKEVAEALQLDDCVNMVQVLHLAKLELMAAYPGVEKKILGCSLEAIAAHAIEKDDFHLLKLSLGEPDKGGVAKAAQRVSYLEDKTLFLYGVYSGSIQSQCHLINRASPLEPDRKTLLHLACKYNRHEMVVYLLNFPELDLEWLTKSGQTVIHTACIHGSSASLEILLKSGKFVGTSERTSIDFIDAFGLSAMHYACFYDHKGAVELLLQSGASAELSMSYHCGVFQYARAIEQKEKRSLESSQDYLEKVTAKASTHTKDSPIHCACRNGSEEVLQLLSNQQPSLLSSQNAHGDSLYHTTVEAGSISFLTKLLIVMGSQKTDDPLKINRINHAGDSALHLAVTLDKYEMINLLLSIPKISISIQNAKGESPASIALKKSDKSTIALLFRHGAFNLQHKDSGRAQNAEVYVKYLSRHNYDGEHNEILLNIIQQFPHEVVKIVDRDGDGLMHHACMKAQFNLMLQIAQYTSLKVTSVNAQGETPFLTACRLGMPRIVQRMLERDELCVDLRAATTAENTALHLAASSQNKTLKPSFADIIYQLSQYGDFTTTYLYRMNREGMYPIHLAVISQNVEAIHEISTMCRDNPELDFNIKTNKGKTALHLAVESGNLEILKVTLRLSQFHLGLDRLDDEDDFFDCEEPIMQDEDGNTPLHLACISRNLDMVKLMLSQGEHQDSTIRPYLVSLSVRNHLGYLPLQLAYQFRQDNPQLLAITCEAMGRPSLNLKKTNQFGDTPLQQMIRMGKSISAIRKAIKNKVGNINDVNFLGQSALHVALDKRNQPVVQLLLQQECIDCNVVSNEQITPLGLAIKNGYMMLAASMIELDADPCIGKLNNQPVLHALCEMAESGIPLILARMDRIDAAKNKEILSKHFVVVLNQTNERGQTLFHIAVEMRSVELIGRLCQLEGVDINSQDNHGMTPLLLATHQLIRRDDVELADEEITAKNAQNTQMIKSLIELPKIDIFVKGIEDKTAIHWAVLRESSECVTLLSQYSSLPSKQLLIRSPAEKGCEDFALVSAEGYGINSQDNLGSTPLHYASQLRNGGIFTTLIYAGADVHIKNNRHSTVFERLEAEQNIQEQDVGQRETQFVNLKAVLVKAESEMPWRQDSERNTHFQKACSLDNQELMQRMIKATSSSGLEDSRTISELVNHQNKQGKTAMHIAISSNAINAVRILLGLRVVNIYLAENSGQTLLHYAVGSSLEMLNLLLEPCAPLLSVKDTNGYTPLHCACLRSNRDIVAAILATSSREINDLDSWGQSPMHLACQVGNSDIIDQLSGAGAKLDLVNFNGLSPLHYAVTKVDKQTLEALLDIDTARRCLALETVMNPIYLLIRQLETEEDFQKIEVLVATCKANNIAINFCVAPIGDLTLLQMACSVKNVKYQQKLLTFLINETVNVPITYQWVNGSEGEKSAPKERIVSNTDNGSLELVTAQQVQESENDEEEFQLIDAANAPTAPLLDVNQLLPNGVTLLHWLVQKNEFHTIQYLLLTHYQQFNLMVENAAGKTARQTAEELNPKSKFTHLLVAAESGLDSLKEYIKTTTQLEYKAKIELASKEKCAAEKEESRTFAQNMDYFIIDSDNDSTDLNEPADLNAAKLDEVPRYQTQQSTQSSLSAQSTVDDDEHHIDADTATDLENTLTASLPLPSLDVPTETRPTPRPTSTTS
ncbi:MAG: ankyrin repeat domain-containing protein [Parashewanella sp.]